MLNIDWSRLFVPSVPIVETIIRGTVVYLVVFTLLRLVLKRETAALNLTDLLVIVLIADAVQDAMSFGHQSITDGLILVVVIIFWDYALDWLAYHYPRVERFVHPPPLLLVRDGRIERQALQRELITETELYGLLRQEGAEEISNVERAYLESNGRISVILRQPPGQGDHERRAPPV